MPRLLVVTRPSPYADRQAPGHRSGRGEYRTALRTPVFLIGRDAEPPGWLPGRTSACRSREARRVRGPDAPGVGQRTQGPTSTDRADDPLTSRACSTA